LSYFFKSQQQADVPDAVLLALALRIDGVAAVRVVTTVSFWLFGLGKKSKYRMKGANGHNQLLPRLGREQQALAFFRPFSKQKIRRCRCGITNFLLTEQMRYISICEQRGICLERIGPQTRTAG